MVYVQPLIPGGGEECRGPSSLDSLDGMCSEAEIEENAEMEMISDFEDGFCSDDSTCVSAETDASGITDVLIELDMRLALELCWPYMANLNAAVATSHWFMWSIYQAQGRPLHTQL